MTPDEIEARTAARMKWLKDNLSPDEWAQVVGAKLPVEPLQEVMSTADRRHCLICGTYWSLEGEDTPRDCPDCQERGTAESNEEGCSDTCRRNICPDDPDGLHHSACGCDDVDPINPNIPAEDVVGIAHRWFDQVINTCGGEYVEQVHDEYERLCSVISAQPVVKGLQPRAEAVAAFFRTIADADASPLIPEGMDEDPCGGTGVVECWNPGGPCSSEQRASGCELCGPCRACATSSPTPRPAAPDDHGLDDERDDAWWYGPDTEPDEVQAPDATAGDGRAA